MIQFILNDTAISTSVPPGTLLLDFIRYHKNLMGTKIGCREGDCGACTILVGEITHGQLHYRSATSCLMAIGNAKGKHIVTVEGVNVNGLNFIQQCFAEEGATQCDFVHRVLLFRLQDFALMKSNLFLNSAIDAVNGNICRCTGYKSIERAAAKITAKLEERTNDDVIGFAVEQNILPAYFKTINTKLEQYISPAGDVTKNDAAIPKYLAGGTDLYVQQHDAMTDTELDFLFDKSHLNGIVQVGNKCFLGASVTVTDVLQSPLFHEHFPDLSKYIKLVSSTQIRNMATIAGNFANASPIGDFTIFFQALDAKLVLSDGIQTREVPLRKFYKGYKKLDKANTEHIEKIYFELPTASSKFNFEKVCKRTHLDIASVNTAIYLHMNGESISDAGIAAGGVGPTPAFLQKSADFLRGKIINAGIVEELLDIVQTEISPISDTRGTATYKRFLLSQLIRAHFITLFPALPVQELMNTAR